MRAAFVLTLLVLSSCTRETLVNENPTIEVLPLALDFGPIPVGIQVSLPLQVRNLGKQELVLQPVTVEGADFSGPTEVVTLRSGEQNTINTSLLSYW